MDEENLISDINITPLVDVLLILLIIIMATLPVALKQVEVALPKTQASAALSDNSSDILIIQQDGTLLFNQKPVSLEWLPRVLQKDKPLIISADKSNTYEGVLKAAAIAQSSGVSQIIFATE